MSILPSRGRVGTTAWMHHVNSNETHREKARWELHKNATSFEKILVAALHKTIALRPLAFHFTNHPSKTSERCCKMNMTELQEKIHVLINILLGALSSLIISVCRCHTHAYLHTHTHTLTHMCVCMFVKNSTNRHMAIINLFQLAIHKSNQPFQITLTQWRETFYENIFNGFFSLKERNKENIWAGVMLSSCVMHPFVLQKSFNRENLLQLRFCQ